MKVLRWGMIGVGSVARHKSGPAFQRAAGSALVGVAARRPEAAAAYAREFGVPLSFADSQELIESPEIDAIYIATPPSSHVPLAMHVARVGKPCCIEKPMAVYLHDALAVHAAFEQAGLPLFVSYYRRSLPRFVRLRQWVQEGAIGALQSVSWELGRVAAAGTDGGWRTRAEEAPGGLFEDLACHGLDLLDWIAQPIVRVDSARLEHRTGSAVPVAVEARWQHDGGVSAWGRWDFAAAARCDRLLLQGTHGRIVCSVFDDTPLVLECAGTAQRVWLEHPTPIQLPHVEALCAHLSGGRTHPSTSASALRTAKVSAEILRLGAADVPTPHESVNGS